MAKDSGSTVLLLGALGVGVYGYFQGWFASLGLAPAASASTTPAGGASAPSSPASPASPSTPAAPAYSGPSLAAVFSQLSAAEQADFGSNSALSCGTDAAGTFSGTGVASLPPRQGTGFSSGGVATGATPTGGRPTGMMGLGATSCSDPIASYDVHNWYLVNRTNAKVPDGLLDGSGQGGPLSQYWAWAAPQLQQHFPGLSGLGDVYRGLGALVRMRRGW